MHIGPRWFCEIGWQGCEKIALQTRISPQWKQTHMAQCVQGNRLLRQRCRRVFTPCEMTAAISLAAPLLSPTLPSVVHLIQTKTTSPAASNVQVIVYFKKIDIHNRKQKNEYRVIKVMLLSLLRLSMCKPVCLCRSGILSAFVKSLAVLRMWPGTAGARSSTSLLSSPFFFTPLVLTTALVSLHSTHPPCLLYSIVFPPLLSWLCWLTGGSSLSKLNNEINESTDSEKSHHW